MKSQGETTKKVDKIVKVTKDFISSGIGLKKLKSISSIDDYDVIVKNKVQNKTYLIDSSLLGGSGIQTIAEGTNITVDNTDPLNPIISVQDITLSGEVTGSTSLSAIDKTAITNKTTETIVGTDYVLFGDTSDGDNLKKGLVSDIVALSGGGGGGSPAGSDTQIQINQSGAFFADSTFQKSDTDFNVGFDHTVQSPVTFTGSGLDDLTVVGTFTGTVPTTYTVTIDGVNQDFLLIDNSTITGGVFNVGDTITSGTGGNATVLSISTVVVPSFATLTYLRVTVTSPFTKNESVDNGLGVSGTLSGNVYTTDTVEWTDGVVTETNYPITSPFIILNSGITCPIAGTGHTLTDEWTWDYTTVNQNVLDFSTNDYKFQSTFGDETFGYQISDNLLGFGLKGSVSTWTNISGDIGFSGIFNNPQPEIIDQLSFADGNSTTQSLLKNQYYVQTNMGTAASSIGMTATTFGIGSSLSSGEHGISQSAGVVSVGNLVGGNNTKITIDDVNEQITISNLSAYDDDTAAGVGGLTAGMVYMTTGSGSAPLNAAGILMIKQ